MTQEERTTERDRAVRSLRLIATMVAGAYADYEDALTADEIENLKDVQEVLLGLARSIRQSY